MSPIFLAHDFGTLTYPNPNKHVLLVLVVGSVRREKWMPEDGIHEYPST